MEAPALGQISLLPLGLIDGQVVGRTHTPFGETTYLSLVDLAAGGTLREVGEIEAQSVTVAVDLLTRTDSTVDRPDPAWVQDQDEEGGSDGAKVAIVVGVAGVLALLGRLWWRRRQSSVAR